MNDHNLNHSVRCNNSETDEDNTAKQKKTQATK